VTAAFDQTKLQTLGKIIVRLLSIVIRQTFSALADEEHLIIKYKVSHIHKKLHQTQHAAFIRKVQTIALHVAKEARISNKQVHSSFAQKIIQLYAGWLVDHVSKVDRELAALLIGKAPESELESDIETHEHLVVPHSYTSFLDSDNASIQDRNLFERMKKMLKLSTKKANN
ncbi:MAG: hypothetical protein EZS28_026527, partial [Streblomastix strix]